MYTADWASELGYLGRDGEGNGKYLDNKGMVNCLDNLSLMHFSEDSFILLFNSPAAETSTLLLGFKDFVHQTDVLFPCKSHPSKFNFLDTSQNSSFCD